MKIKDKEYEKHLKEMERDRDKHFGGPQLSAITETDRYVAAWCRKNYLRHEGNEPICKCGRPCHWYGAVGGYSRRCKECNAEAAAKQRARRSIRSTSKGSA